MQRRKARMDGADERRRAGRGVEVLAVALSPGPMRAVIVLHPDAVEADIRAAIPRALALQKELNRDHWPSGDFVRMASEAQAEGQFSYAELARWGNWEVWRGIDNALIVYGDPYPSAEHQQYEREQVESAIRQLIAIRGGRAAESCRQAVEEALENAKRGLDADGTYVHYELVDEDMVKTAIRRFRKGGG